MLRSGALGDTLLVLPVCAALRRRWPGYRVRLVADRRWCPLLAWAPDVAEVQAIETWPLHEAYAGQPSTALMAKLAEDHLTLIYSVDPKTLSRTLRGVGSRRLVMADPRPPDPGAAHAVETLAAPLGLAWRGEDVLLTPPEDAVATAKAACDAMGLDSSRLLALHPGSGGVIKRWAPEAWQAVVSWASERLGAQPLVLLGPAETEGCALDCRALASWPSVCPRDTAELGAWLALARAYAGNDAGPTHAAGQLGTPTLAVFGPTDARVWRPLGPRVWVCRPDVEAVRATLAEAWGR